MTATVLTKADFAPRFALLVGTFSSGWSLARVIIGSRDAEHAAATHMRAGMMAEAVPILWPSDLSDEQDDEASARGHHYLMMSDGVVGGSIKVYGPFLDDAEAEEAGEEYRPEDGEYRVVVDPEQQDLVASHERIPDDLVDSVVKEFSSALPLLNDASVVTGLKTLVRARFIIKENNQESWEAVMSAITLQLKGPDAAAIDDINDLVRQVESGGHAEPRIAV